MRLDEVGRDIIIFDLVIPFISVLDRQHGFPDEVKSHKCEKTIANVFF